MTSANQQADHPIELLIADDNPGDVRIVQEILRESELSVTMTTAQDGLEAAERFKAGPPPDIVITDLQMPRMNGLELVSTIQQHWPMTPVILMTAFGNETIAIEALDRGAASYVPKAQLQSELVSTFKQVVEIAQGGRQRDRMLSCLSYVESHFVLENDNSLVPMLINHLQDNMARMKLFDETTRIQVGIALTEAIDNAIYHGNLEVDSAVREKDYDEYFRLADQRRGQDKYKGRTVRLTANESRAKAVYVVEDDGSGFDVSSLPDPTSSANLDKVSGRGLLLIRTFMDEVSHDRQGTRITMTIHANKSN
jgi:CheY-like chemotaxis protein